MRARSHSGLCGPDCAYRRLYEGSQASLADMAGKQAGALNRVARLRGAIVAALKQTFPVEFGEAEAQLSKRMSSTDDEVLLAYLGGFLTLPSRRAVVTAAEPAGVEDLRDELESLGISLPDGSDLGAWAQSVATYAQAAAARTLQTPNPEHGTETRDETAAEGAAAGASSRGKTRRRTGNQALLAAAPSAGFATTGDTPPPAAKEPVAEPANVSWDDEDTGWGDEPDDGDAAADLGLDFGVVAETSGSLDDLFVDDATDPGGGDLSSLFGDDLPSADPESLVDALFSTPHDERDPVPVPAVPAPQASHADPRTDESRSQGNAPDALRENTPRTPQQREPDAAPAPAAVPVREPAVVSAPEAEFPVPPTAPGLANQPAVSSSAKTTSAALSGSAGGGTALRPELFPATQLPKGGRTTRRSPKTSRVNAAPPDPRGLDVPISEGATGADLTEELFEKLVASVCIPRPVFVSDLVAQTGSPELVTAWEQRCRDMGTTSPVRFITPKTRHRDRGALILPHSPELRKAASEFTRSWWATCLDERRLRGAKLYEVAVLLHRFGESIISSRIDGDVVVLRVNQARGLVGVAVALESDLAPGAQTRKTLADAVGELLADRLTLVAVLTYSAGGGTLEKLAAAIREESEERGWRPTTPVIASLSWDFAADGGSSALSVL